MLALNTDSTVDGNMKKFKGFVGITPFEYREYKQNGCIRVKDYPKERRKRRNIDDEEIPFTIYEMLDVEEWSLKNPYRLFHKSFSFGDLHIERSMGDILIDVMNPDYKPYVIKRLKHFGLNPQEESDGRICV